MGLSNITVIPLNDFPTTERAVRSMTANMNSEFAFPELLEQYSGTIRVDTMETGLIVSIGDTNEERAFEFLDSLMASHEARVRELYQEQAKAALAELEPQIAALKTEMEEMRKELKASMEKPSGGNEPQGKLSALTEYQERYRELLKLEDQAFMQLHNLSPSLLIIDDRVHLPD